MRTNEISKTKKITLFIAVAIMSVLGCGVISAQPCPCSVSAQTGERLPAGFYAAGTDEAAALGYAPAKFRSSSDDIYGIYGSIFAPYKKNLEYDGNDLYYTPTTVITENSIINPYEVAIELYIPGPMDLVYSLYTYKTKFSQNNKRYSPGHPYYVDSPSYGATQDCGAGVEFKNQEDIDDNLDLIYTFDADPSTEEVDPFKEPGNGVRYIDWNGKTSGIYEEDANGDMRFIWDGEKNGNLAVRDCVLLVIHDSKGEFVGFGGGD